MSSLPYLETFAAVVDKGSFTAAAAALGISKPVVSKQVSQKDKSGKDIGVKVTGNLRSDAGTLLLGAALDGRGLLIGPTYMLAKAVRETQLETVLEDYDRPATGLYAIYPHSKLVSSKVRAFVDYCAETWGDLA